MDVDHSDAAMMTDRRKGGFGPAAAGADHMPEFVVTPARPILLYEGHVGFDDLADICKGGLWGVPVDPDCIVKMRMPGGWSADRMLLLERTAWPR